LSPGKVRRYNRKYPMDPALDRLNADAIATDNTNL